MKYAIQTSPLTNNIYAGRLNKRQDAFLDDKEEVTNMAIFEVARHVWCREDGVKTVTVETTNGKQRFDLSVSLSEQEDTPAAGSGETS